jgi:hypothetical protein
MRHWQLASIVAVVVLLLSASSALAGGKGAQTDTQTEQNVTETFVDVIPCPGDPLYTITLTYNSVIHMTEGQNGFHVTFTQTGQFVAEPLDDSSLPTYTGHVTIWGGFNGNRQNAASTFTFNLSGKGSDGSKLTFHLVEHFNVTATGVEHFFSKDPCA